MEKKLFKEEINVNKYKFEPIKGYPMLNWKGKRPFKATQFYPAQLKERFGTEEENWINKIFWGDNIQVMSHLLKEYRGKVNLIYIDPPYDSKADYKKSIELKGARVSNNRNSFEEKQYTDIWTNDEYLQFMYERLILMRELLSDNGSIFVHCDWHKAHHLRCILDEIFGNGGKKGNDAGYKNEIIWCYSVGGKSTKKFGEKHDSIFWYTKGNQWVFNKKGASVPRKLNSHMKLLIDENGREYQQKIDKKSGKIYTYYLDEGKVAEDYWIDVETLNREDKERMDYPTQKPEKLLKRIIETASNEGDIIFDCFMGSGTTQAVAMKLERKFIGADINLGAIQTTTKRLLNIQKEIKNDKKLIDEERKYMGFEVYNVNNYDFFRNEVEAKDLLIEALEIQKIEKNNIFDGEKDGRMVKIMPVNRIATKADIESIISNLDVKKYQKRMDESPTKAVEKITLVCMGHEPDLKVALESELKPLEFDIEIVDILKDKSNLELKREAEIEIKIEGEKLRIEKFYPMNLLQKLSIMKEDAEDWTELVESIYIDWNYDGATLEPSVMDIPGKKEVVKGVYDIPEDAGTIMVKITDLLSESIEWEVQNG